MKKYLLFLSCLFLFTCSSLGSKTESEPPSSEVSEMVIKPPSKVDYPAVKIEIVEERKEFGERYRLASREGQAVILIEAKLQIRSWLSEKLIPAWYGTDWDFNGTTQVPGQGLIACGYFVSTLLRDAGYRLERIRLAQQASLNIIRSLCPADNIRDWSGITTSQLKQKMQGMNSGFYVVGLDQHTGFLLLDEEHELWFLHASYGDPAVVVCEKAVGSKVLSWSNRFVVGYIENEWLLKKWLANEKITTKT